MIHFLLNHRTVRVEQEAPDLNILDWLRTKAGIKSSKEGCGTGDCGACTVLVGSEVVDSGGNTSWYYKTINSCLMLLGNAHGKHIITLDALTPKVTPELADLHPVQRAMVELHGSQCGFCTPGFIMSLLALYINNVDYPGKKAVIHALSGNLCRCTGYSPILKAAEKCYEYPRQQETWSTLAAEYKKQQSALENNQPSLTLQGARFYLPQKLSALLTLKQQYPNGKLLAGATDLSIELSQELLEIETFISVAQVSELCCFEETDTAFIIGAALAYNEFIEPLCQHFPEALQLFQRLGSTQVRNSGTLGGSLANASPIGDPAPLLIALNAQLILQSTTGSRTIAVEDLFVGYRQTVLQKNEVIHSIIIPKRKATSKLACHKISKRFEDDISTVCLIVAVEVNNNTITSARCAMGGMAAIPARAKKVENFLTNNNFSVASFISASKYIEQDFSPMTDVRASAFYRTTVAKNLLTRIGYEFCELNKTENEHDHIHEQITKHTETRINHAAS
ncbi:MAG: xanthine dehydrogenase small subunit [Colwellia sp.]